MATWKLHSHVRAALRQAWLRSPIRNEAVKTARIERGIYLCAICKKTIKAKEIEVDHKIPVGATPGSRNATASDSWDAFINRLFCDVHGLHVLCHECHLEKRSKVA